jgi:hypothetical protein
MHCVATLKDPATQPVAPASGLNATPGQGDWSIPMFNTGESNGIKWGSQAGVLGTILFNFGFVTTIPSWVNEKKPEVSVNNTVWLSTTMCLVIFYVIGIPGTILILALLLWVEIYARGACTCSRLHTFLLV